MGFIISPNEKKLHFLKKEKFNFKDHIKIYFKIENNLNKWL